MALEVGPGLGTLRASQFCLSGDRGCSAPVWPSEDLKAYFRSSTTSSRAVVGSGQGPPRSGADSLRDLEQDMAAL